jgi:hypothetical protein
MLNHYGVGSMTQKYPRAQARQETASRTTTLRHILWYGVHSAPERVETPASLLP